MSWDASVYYVLGTSLAQGSGYRLLNEPGAIQSVQYPPFMPTVIAFHQKLFGTDDFAVVSSGLKPVWITLHALLSITTFLVLRRWMSLVWAFAATVLCTLNFAVYLHASQCTAELPFALASVAFLAVFRPDGSRLRGVLAAAVVVVAFFSRTIGVALMLAWILDGLLRKQFRLAALRSTLAVACVSLWSGYIYHVEHSAEYARTSYAYQRADYLFYNVTYLQNIRYVDPYRPELGQLTMAGFAERALSNLRAIPMRMGEALTSERGFWVWQANIFASKFSFPKIDPWITSFMLAAIGLFSMAGLYMLFVAGERLLSLYVLLTVLALCAAAPWPPQHVRYLVPVVPLLMLACGYAISTFLAACTSRRVVHACMQAVACCVFLSLLAHSCITYYLTHTKLFPENPWVYDRQGRPIPYRQISQPDRIAMDEAIHWLSGIVRPGDVVAAAMPQWVFLRTGAHAVMPPLEIDTARERALLDSVPVKYLLHESPSFVPWRYVDSMLQSYPQEWRLVYTASGGLARVYERSTPRK